jgi:hypothetical protein
VSVNDESTSNTLVALPTAVGIRLVEKDCPDATDTKVDEVAGLSTIAGILLLDELDKDLLLCVLKNYCSADAFRFSCFFLFLNASQCLKY